AWARSLTEVASVMSPVSAWARASFAIASRTMKGKRSGRRVSTAERSMPFAAAASPASSAVMAAWTSQSAVVPPGAVGRQSTLGLNLVEVPPHVCHCSHGTTTDTEVGDVLRVLVRGGSAVRNRRLEQVLYGAVARGTGDEPRT